MRRALLIAALLPGLSAIAACGDDGTDATGPDPEPEPEPEPIALTCDDDAPLCGVDLLYDDRIAPRFYLDIPASSWDVMATCDGDFGADRPPECDYHPATFHAVFDPDARDDDPTTVTTTARPVGVRRKGRFTWRELAPPDPTFTGNSVVGRRGKPSLKVKFTHDDGERFLGLSRLTLNNSRQDPSALRERLGYELYRAAGVTAPQANSAEVFVRGPGDPAYVRWGLYANVQSIDKRFLLTRFGDTDGEVGNLYDTHNDTYFTDLDRCPTRDQAGHAPGAQEARFDLETNTSQADTSDLTAAIDAVYVAPPAGSDTCASPSTDATQLLPTLEPVLDVDAFLRAMAVDAWLANWDGFAGARNNYLLYRDLERDRFVLIPWGIDQTFGWQDQVHYPNWHYAPDHTRSNRARSLLMRRCSADTTGCLARYLDHVAEVASLADDLDLPARLQTLAAQVRPLVDWSDAELELHIGFLEQFITTRTACVASRLADEPCEPLPCPLQAGSCDPESRL